MIAAGLVDRRIQFEMDLIEPVDKSNPQIFTVSFPDQTLRNSIRQTEPEQATISAARPVVKPIARQSQILRHNKGRIDKWLGEGSGIEQCLVSAHQRNDIHILRGPGNQSGCIECCTSANDQVVSRRSV